MCVCERERERDYNMQSAGQAIILTRGFVGLSADGEWLHRADYHGKLGPGLTGYQTGCICTVGV